MENNSYVYEYNPYLNQEYIRYDFISPDKSIWDLDSLSGKYGIYDTEQHYISIYGDYLNSKIYNSAYINTKSNPPDTTWGAMVDGLAIVVSKGLGITEYGQGTNIGTFYGAVINGDTLGTIVSVNKSDQKVITETFTLFQNYPNPFNPTTIITYSIFKNDFVSIKVYDLLGREIATLINKELLKGNYSVEFNAENLSSGVYFYQLTTSQFSETKKMLLLR